MVIRRARIAARRAAGLAAAALRRTRVEVGRLQRAGVFSKKDAGRVLNLFAREARAGAGRLARFAAAELRHDLVIAKRLRASASRRVVLARKVVRSKSGRRSKGRRKRR